MAVKVNPTSVLLGIATVILTTLTTISSGEGLPRDCMLNQVKANSKNPHTFYWCLPDGPVLFHCIDDLVFDTHAKKCITEKQKLQKSRDKRGSKVTVLPLSTAQALQFQKDKKPNAQAQPDKKPTPQAKPEMNPNAQAQPNKKPNPQAKPEMNPSAQAQPEKKPTALAQPEQKPTPQEPQDKKSTSPYYYSTLYPFPSRFIPSQPSVPSVTETVASQAPSSDSPEFVPDCPVPQFGRDAPLILIPSQDYCDEFFFCSNGKSFRFTCPKDTDFNSELRVCDHVRNIKCASGKRRRDLIEQDESAVPRVAPSSSQISTSSSL